MRIVIYSVFFLSGAAALAYEISWSRQIGLLFGHTATAAATVLASYFAGLGLGYWLGGRLAERTKSPLAAYGWMELAAAAWAALVPTFLWAFESPALVWLIHHSDPTAQTIVRAACCLLLLLPATTALGATLPLMASWLDNGEPHTAARVAWAYGLNTWGGLLGVLATTWILLSVVGVTASGYLAAAVSTLCGVTALLVGRLVDGSPSEASPNEDNTKTLAAAQVPFNAAPKSLRPLIVLVAVCGFATLALEVLYTRMFALVFHNSTYTFGLVVAVVLFALAAGAWLAAWAQRHADAVALAGWANLGAAAAISLSTLIFLAQTNADYFTGGHTFAHYMLASLGLVALVVLLPALLLGMILPLLWKAALNREGDRKDWEGEAPAEPTEREATTTGPRRALSVSTVVGRLTAANTLSAAAGALTASFLLLALLGLWTSIALVALSCLASGIALLLRTARPHPMHAGVPLLVFFIIVAVWGKTNQRTSVPPGHSLVYRSESAHGWIDVVRDEQWGDLDLRENVNYTHGSTRSARWERRQAHIPLLLHDDPREVLFLGCGTGATAGGAVMHDDVESITIVELIPQVIDAARLFAESNLGVLDDSRTKIRIDDARHFLLATDKEYDVIIADLFVPWETKTGYLYTVDHYRVARQRLAPGGLFCQWLPMWQLGQREFEMIADSFASVFPHTTVWLGKGSYNRTIIALVGSESPLQIDGRKVHRRIDEVFRNERTTDTRLDEPRDLSRRYIGDWKLRGGDSLLNSDEHPRLEFAMPLTYADRRTLKRKPMQQFHRDVLTQLGQSGVKLSNFAGDAAVNRRHAWQSLQLRK